MRTQLITSRRILFLILFFSILPLPVLAAEECTAPKPDAEGWITLFNGKDLTGWQMAHEPRVDPLWMVENKTMTNKEGARDIATIAEYKDFDLTLEFRTVAHGNSGVYLRGRIEVQVLDSFGNANPGDGDCGAIYGQFAPKVNASKPAGEWNTLEVHLVGDTFTAKLNGQVIHDQQKLTEVSGGALPGGLLDAGPLRLQGDHGKVWYRNIKLKPITGEKKGK